jgi:nucleotide-binding universal stress UspA family protein
MKAAQQGLELAKQLGARVTAVTVSEPWSAFEMAQRSRDGSRNPIDGFEQEAATRATAILARVGDLAKMDGVVCELVHISDKRPAEGIVDLAETKQCDVIVIGSHGRRAIAKLILGSQASEVLALSPMPVLICR